MSRGWTKWLQLGLAGVGLLALLTGLVAVSYVHNVRWDLSSGQRFTLSDYGLGVLRNLDRKVHITSFIRTQDTRNPFLKDLLWQAAHESPYLSYEVVDINRHPAVATSRGVHTYGASIVESDSRRADFSQPTETQLISAIVHVTQPSKKVYVWQGHGECSMADTHRRNGCSGLRDAISTEFYEVAALSLLAGKQVPADAAVVVIAGPRSDPLEEELRSLATYLDQGGKLLVMLEPFRTTALAALLGRYGIEVGQDVVLDPDNRLSGGEAISAVVKDVNHRHLLTATLDSPPLFSGMRSLRAYPDEARGLEVSSLLSSGARSWASHDPRVLGGRRPTFVAGRDVNGPLNVGLEVSLPAAAGNDSPRTRIIAFGDADFVSNRFLDYLGNKDLLLNSINWLSRAEALIAPRAKTKKPGKHQFFVSQAEGRRLFWATVVVQPGLFLAVGVLVLLVRRFSS